MSLIRTNAAATMLGVSPNTLRSWERRFAYPTPRRTEGGHRQFELSEIEALRQAFAETQNISSAISLARERGEGPSSPARLKSALAAFDEHKANILLEESLAVRSVERTVESVLLPAVGALPQASPEYCFAWRFATCWLAAIQRAAPPATREQSVVIFDAAAPLQADSLHVQALELFLRRCGLRVLTLPVELEPGRLANALRALTPDAVVLACRGELDRIGRLVHAARLTSEGVRVFDYLGAVPESTTSTVQRLGPGAIAASEQLRAHLADLAGAARKPRAALAAI
ncbi:MAG TPA: MerR family transcriptional regulator [Solirubrobacteraceae bacterium]